ncbi:MAG: hypothetical protein LC623_09385 [Halobacteriales archaeon]|nr:hypothetical protein [Halobacteriales archaeon]
MQPHGRKRRLLVRVDRRGRCQRGECGSLLRIDISNPVAPVLSGFGAVSVAGHASCDEEFDVFALNLLTAQCIGGADVVDQVL